MFDPLFQLAHIAGNRDQPGGQASRPVHRDALVQQAWDAVKCIDLDRARESMTVFDDKFTGARAAYIERAGQSATIVFRTTMTLHDVLHDFDMRQTRFIGDARVHRGFCRKYLSLRDRLHAIVLERAPAHILLCGHSLGGALACMAAVDLHTCFEDVEIDVVTFGAPRAGNLAFTQQLKRAAHRYVRVRDRLDLIPDMPGTMLGFTHGFGERPCSLHNFIARFLNSLFVFVARPTSHHFNHFHDYYDDALRARRLVTDESRNS